MDIRALRTAEDYEWAIQEVDRYFADQPEVGSDDGQRFEVLLALIEKYENEHHPIEQADPVDVLTYAMSNSGRSQNELATILGARSRASEILSRKRPLNLNQIRSISAAWHIPIAALAAPYRLVQRPKKKVATA